MTRVVYQDEITVFGTILCRICGTNCDIKEVEIPKDNDVEIVRICAECLDTEFPFRLIED